MVIDVFTPDGTYSAFGATYALARLPGARGRRTQGPVPDRHPAPRARRRHRHRQQPLCFVDQTNHDMRIGYYTDTYRRTADGWRLHTRAMTFLRRSGSTRLRSGARPARRTRAPARADRSRMDLDEFRVVPRRLARRARRRARSRPYAGPGPSTEQMAQLAKVKRLTFDAGWMRWGWPERVGGLGGSTLLRGLPRRGAHRPRTSSSPGIYSHDRGAGADHDRLRPARAGGRDGAAAAAR